MATQQERVAQAVEQAWANLEDEGINPVLATSDQAINSLTEYVESEPSANELKAFKKEWLKRQAEGEPDTEEAEAAEDMAAVDEANEAESSRSSSGGNGSNGAKTKLDELRAAAVKVAREKLGDEADDAPYMKAYMALADEDPESEAGQFYLAAQESPRQLGNFGRDFQATQPKSENGGGGKGKLFKKYQDELAELRKLMAELRKATEADEVRQKLSRVRELLDVVETKAKS